MNYNLNLNDHPFKAIKAGTKKIEGRTPRDASDTRYDQMKGGDTITFTNNITGEVMRCDITTVHKYSDVRLMLETEGIENVLPGETDIANGVEVYHKLDGYKERIQKFGIYAIAIKI